MSVLKLIQKTNDGRTKSWKHNGSSELLTFGTSRKAKMVSIDDNVQSFESVLEYRNSEWHYISFAINNDNSKLQSSDIVLNQNTEISFKNSTLKFEVLNKKLELIKNIEAISLNGAASQQLVLVTQNHKIISVHVKDPEKLFNFYSEGKAHNIKLPLTDNWNSFEHNCYTIKSKKIKTEDISLFTDSARGKKADKENNTATVVTLSVTFILIAISLLVPNIPKSTPVIGIQNASTVIVKSDLKKRNKIDKPSVKAPQNEIVQNNKTAASGGGKVAALLKGAIGVRISKLIGKVSATEARTANILVTTAGVKAGESASGRALAAIGKVESSGRNWNGESKGSGQGVSTAGVGGGQGRKGLSGGLGQGKTGSGGVGLIEEESEIIGGLDREVIAQYIKTQLGQILYCYERQLSANPNLYGKIAVKFTIAGTGQVETQSINDTTLKNISVESCILNKISKWKFPEPKGGTKVLVTYPFLFKSTI